MPPKYNLDKIQFATDGPTFEKAVDLYEKGKVTQFEEGVGVTRQLFLAQSRIGCRLRRGGRLIFGKYT